MAPPRSKQMGCKYCYRLVLTDKLIIKTYYYDRKI